MAVIFASLFIVLSFSFASSLQDDINNRQDYLPQKQKLGFNLVVQSNNATACNLSYIQYPNGLSTIFNLPLAKNGNTFSLSVGSSNYSQLGSICHGVVCGTGSSVETGAVCREITPSGFTKTATFFFIFIVIIGLVFAIGVKLENKWIMTLASILVLLFGFFILINGIDIIKDTMTTYAIGLIVWALGIYFMYLSVEEMLKEWN